MFVKTILVSSMAIALGVSTAVNADKRGGFTNFNPIDSSANSADWNPAAPWKLPKGYTQSIVADETALNVFNNGRDDWHDMNTVNETGAMAGRFMYRTHELRSPDNQPEGGAVTVVDLNTGDVHLLAQDSSYDALDGIRWTPWGTVLFAEEVTGGRLLEIELNDDMISAKAVHDRPAVGRLAHEGIDVDSDGNVYVVDEFRGRTSQSSCAGSYQRNADGSFKVDGSGNMMPVAACGGGIYKFVPHVAGDLSSGDLYVLGVPSGERRDNTGQGVWLGPIDAANARASGSEFGGASYQRPEDLEIIGDVLYVAITEGPRDEYASEYYEGRVISVNLKTLEVADFVKAGVNVPVEIGRPGQANFQTGFDSVDNLAEAPNGDLVMIEDNSPSDIWFASTKTNEYGASSEVRLFGSLTDPGAEGTGIYFSPFDANTLYVNVQHSAADDGDATWAITRQGRGHDYDRKKDRDNKDRRDRKDD